MGDQSAMLFAVLDEDLVGVVACREHAGYEHPGTFVSIVAGSWEGMPVSSSMCTPIDRSRLGSACQPIRARSQSFFSSVVRPLPSSLSTTLLGRTSLTRCCQYTGISPFSRRLVMSGTTHDFTPLSIVSRKCTRVTAGAVSEQLQSSLHGRVPAAHDHHVLVVEGIRLTVVVQHLGEVFPPTPRRLGSWKPPVAMITARHRVNLCRPTHGSCVDREITIEPGDGCHFLVLTHVECMRPYDPPVVR